MKEAHTVALHASPAFDAWIADLRDIRAKAKIAQRLDRLRQGNPGDVKSVGGGVSELRIKHGPGYRIYVEFRGKVAVILLCGGDKSTQAADIARARKMVADKEVPIADPDTTV